tara:strand:+ start:432 stop:1028 length:597 start_codon:yes stop_codon:yes gene_type:complete
MILLRKYLIYFFIILVIAVSFTYLSSKLFQKFAFIENDIWRVLPSPGDPNRDIYTRAGVAQFGTFALKKPESAYFTATTDIEDEPLSGKCLYKLQGSDIESRWWSITAYASDGFLINNNEKQYSFNSENVDFDINGGFEIFFSSSNDFIREVSNSNWLRVLEDDEFIITLRIYLPGEEFFSNLRRVNLPIIEKIKCTE